jgi:hypothetical protein
MLVLVRQTTPSVALVLCACAAIFFRASPALRPVLALSLPKPLRYRAETALSSVFCPP